MKKLSCKLVQNQLEDLKSLCRAEFTASPADIMNLSLDPSADRLATAGADGFIRIYTLINNKISAEIDTVPQKAERLPLMSIKWLQQEKSNLILAASSGGQILIAHARGEVVARVPEAGNFTMSVDSSPQGNRFATGGKDCQVRIYDTQKREVMSNLQGVDWHRSGHNNRLCCVKYVDNNRIISGGWDQNVQLWDIRDKKSTGTIVGPKICGETIDCKDDVILTGAHRPQKPIELWDYSSCKQINSFEWTAKDIAGAFIFGAKLGQSIDETIFAAASGVNECKILSTLEKHKQLGLLKVSATPYCLDVSKRGGRWAVGMAGGGVVMMQSRSKLMVQDDYEDD